MSLEGSDHEEYLPAVKVSDKWFHVRPVDGEEVWRVRWRHDLARATYRPGGITGTVERHGVADEQRVHVCAHIPCTRVHNASKQKLGMLPPLHVRLVCPGTDEGVHELAVAGPGDPAGDATPPMDPPVDDPLIPPSPPPTPPPAPLDSYVESDEVEGSDSSTPRGSHESSDASIDDIEDGLPGPDITEVDHPPWPAFVPGEAGHELILPGLRTLLPIPALATCDVRVPVPVPSTITKTRGCGARE